LRLAERKPCGGGENENAVGVVGAKEGEDWPPNNLPKTSPQSKKEFRRVGKGNQKLRERKRKLKRRTDRSGFQGEEAENKQKLEKRRRKPAVLPVPISSRKDKRRIVCKRARKCKEEKKNWREKRVPHYYPAGGNQESAEKKRSTCRRTLQPRAKKRGEVFWSGFTPLLSAERSRQ